MKNGPIGLHLAPIDFNEYKSLHSLIYSDDSLKYDDPNRPIPTSEDSKQWWLTKVKNNEHLVLSIRLKKMTFVVWFMLLILIMTFINVK